MIDKRYNSQKWKRLRQNVLKRDGYICREMRRYGLTEEAVLVHHVYPVREHPELFFNEDNLISLSIKGHELMHDRLTDEITPTGKRWQDKLKDKIFKLSPPGL